MTRLYVYVAAAIALCALIAYETHVHRQANQFEAARKDLAAERIAHKSDLAQVKANLAASLEERQKLQQGLADITERFNQPLPPAKTLVRTVEVPGACPRLGVSAEFVSVFNNAASP